MENLRKIMSLTVIIISTLNSFYAQQTLQEAFNASYTLEYNGEYVKAVEAIKVAFDENSYESNLRAGWLNYEAGLYIESQNYYKKAMALRSNSIEAKFGYISPATALGNMDQVISQYDKIIKIDPKNTTANYMLGSIYYDRKNFQSAFKYFENVVTLYPFGHDALLMFAWTNFQLGKNKEAKNLFKKVLLLSPHSKSALDGLSLIN